MTRRFNFGEIKLTAGDDGLRSIPQPHAPFCIVVLGSFSGRSTFGAVNGGVGRRRPVLVDRDNFDEVLAKTGAAINLPIGGTTPLTLRFSELDDFHPDRLFQNTAIFRQLREVRGQLEDPATFAPAAEELGVKTANLATVTPPASSASANGVASGVRQTRSGGLLNEILEQAEGGVASVAPSRDPDELREFVRRVTQAQMMTAADPLQAETIGMIDRALSAQMRALLHVPDFQSLEAAWRAIFLLLRRIETGSQLQLYLIDISQQELAADLKSSQDLRASETYRLLVERSVGTPGAEPWAVIVGNYTFGPDREGTEQLGRLARIARAAGAPFIAAANARLLGCASLAETPHPRDWRLTPESDTAAAWAELRGLPEASAIGLVLRRFLLRLPYGKKTDPIESFDFEEMWEVPAHEDYLWGNPVFACALLLAQSFNEHGWQMRPGMHSQIDGLPLHLYQREGESELKPCAEALLTEEGAERIMDNGLMPLESLKGRDAIRLVRFQSITDPPQVLAGRWSG